MSLPKLETARSYKTTIDNPDREGEEGALTSPALSIAPQS